MALFAVVVALLAAGPNPPAGKIELLWLGQSAVRITTMEGKVIVVDPFLTKNPKTPPAFKDLNALGKVDLLLVTHAHGDHLGDAPALAKMHHAPLYGPAGLDQSLVTLGILPAELAPRMGKGGTITPLGPKIRITQVRAEHSSELLWHNPRTDQDETHVGGEPVGFIIELENGFRIYHMGDTAIFGDMRLIAERFRPDLLLIPIGGHFVMDPKDAAFVTRDWFKPRFALPFHYGTTPLLAGTPAEYQQALGKGPTRVLELQPGDRTTF